MSNQAVQGTLDILLSSLTSVFLSTRSLFRSVYSPVKAPRYALIVLETVVLLTIETIVYPPVCHLLGEISNR